MATYRSGLGLALLSLCLCAGCSERVNLDEVPVGAAVQVVRDDGALVEGTLTDRSDDRVVVEMGEKRTDVARAAIADVVVVEPDQPMPAPPPEARFREVTVPSSTILVIDFGTTIDTSTSEVGDAVVATLAEAVEVNGLVAIPKGASLAGRVTSVQSSGNVRGRASVTLTFDSLHATGETYALPARFEAEAPATGGEDAKKIGIPAAGGAIIGAILGGGKGAAVGAAIGGGAGAGAVLLTPGKEIRVPAGTTLAIRTHEDLLIKVPIERQEDGGSGA